MLEHEPSRVTMTRNLRKALVGLILASICVIALAFAAEPTLKAQGWIGAATCAEKVRGLFTSGAVALLAASIIALIVEPIISQALTERFDVLYTASSRALSSGLMCAYKSSGQTETLFTGKLSRSNAEAIVLHSWIPNPPEFCSRLTSALHPQHRGVRILLLHPDSAYAEVRAAVQDLRPSKGRDLICSSLDYLAAAAERFREQGVPFEVKLYSSCPTFFMHAAGTRAWIGTFTNGPGIDCPVIEVLRENSSPIWVNSFSHFEELWRDSPTVTFDQGEYNLPTISEKFPMRNLTVEMIDGTPPSATYAAISEAKEHVRVTHCDADTSNLDLTEYARHLLEARNRGVIIERLTSRSLEGASWIDRDALGEYYKETVINGIGFFFELIIVDSVFAILYLGCRRDGGVPLKAIEFRDRAAVLHLRELFIHASIEE